MLEFKNPIPVVVEENKDGYAIYVTNGGQFENDIWCIVLCDGGYVRHYRSDQIRIHTNSTFDIKKTKTKTIAMQKSNKYKSKITSEIIVAEQFIPPMYLPKGVFNVYEVVDKVYCGQIWTYKDERLDIKASDWVVEEPHINNRYYIIPDEAFKNEYEIVNQ